MLYLNDSKNISNEFLISCINRNVIMLISILDIYSSLAFRNLGESKLESFKEITDISNNIIISGVDSFTIAEKINFINNVLTFLLEANNNFLRGTSKPSLVKLEKEELDFLRGITCS